MEEWRKKIVNLVANIGSAKGALETPPLDSISLILCILATILPNNMSANPTVGVDTPILWEIQQPPEARKVTLFVGRHEREHSSFS